MNAPDDDYLHDREEFFTDSIDIVPQEEVEKYERLTMTRALLDDYKRFAVQEALQAMNFDSWWEMGFKLGFVGPPVCYTHDGMPTSFEEDHQFELGSDPCMHIVRLYEDLKHKIDVEDNHSPSIWRAKGW